MIYIALHPEFTMEHLGYIPGFLSEDDPRPAREQLDENYAHGGGVRPMKDWKLVDHHTEWAYAPGIQYPGDPELKPLVMTTLRDEAIYLYPHAFMLIIQRDDSFIVFRID